MYKEKHYKWKNVVDEPPEHGNVVDIWIRPRGSKTHGARVADCICHNRSGWSIFFRSSGGGFVYKHENYEIWWKPQPGAPEEVINN